MKVGIVGGGIFGVSAALELQRRGHRVELFERRHIPASEAASNDISKVIRMEYGAASPLYAPLVERAFERWTELERAAGTRLLHRCGVLFLASSYEESRFEWQSVECLRRLGRRPEVVDARDARKRWPQFSWEGLAVGVFNPDGGWIEASRAVEAIEAAAREAGAGIHQDSEVLQVEEDRESAKIVTARHTGRFDRVLVCAGPWVRRVLPQLEDHVRVTRQQISLYSPAAAQPFDEARFPVWIYDMREEGWYGFPANVDGIVKIALHRRSEIVDPDISREPDASFLEASKRFVGGHLPALDPQSLVAGRVCLYTNSPRGDLAFDRVPGSERLYVAGLGSGHGFKFGPVLGELAADLLERDEVPDELRLGAARKDEVW